MNRKEKFEEFVSAVKTLIYEVDTSGVYKVDPDLNFFVSKVARILKEMGIKTTKDREYSMEDYIQSDFQDEVNSREEAEVILKRKSKRSSTKTKKTKKK